MELEAATLAMVKTSPTGARVVVEDDVANVVRDLQEIDGRLCVRYDPEGFFVVYEKRMLGDGSVNESLVLTALQLDQRIVARVREISGRGYDFVAAMERQDAAADARRDHAFSEKIGPLAEQLRHAMRKDLAMEHDRAFVPREVTGSGGSG